MERFERLAVSEDIGSTLPRFGVPTWVGRSLLGEGSGGCPCPPKPFNLQSYIKFQLSSKLSSCFRRPACSSGWLLAGVGPPKKF